MTPSHDGLSENDRFHCFKVDYADRSIAHALEKGQISEDDAKIIRMYVSERQITHSIKVKRSLKIVVLLVQARRFIGPFRENTIPDLYLGIQAINTGYRVNGTPYSDSTKADIVKTLKTFYLWLIENEFVDLPEKKIRAVKIQRPKPTKTAADLVTAEQVLEMISVCSNSRDRAILMTLYEGGFRIGEVGQMKWGDLKIDGTGVIVNTKFKTDKPRYVRLVMSKEHLMKWRSDYPKDIIDEGYVFLSTKNLPLTYGAIARIIEKTSKKAGIPKHVSPHIFRHSRITHLIQQGVNESVIKLIMWGSIDSNMFANYAHLTGSDVDREIFKLYGIDANTTQVSSDRLEPKVCFHCHEINSPISKHCHICGHPLDEGATLSVDELNDWVVRNSHLLTKFLQEHGAKGGSQPCNISV